MSKITLDSPERTNEVPSATFLSMVGILIGGAALGLVGAFLQAVEVSVGPLTIPFWTVIVLAAMLSTARAITINYGSRKPAIAWFVGWISVTLLLSMPLPSGDQVVSDGIAQMIYVFGGAVLGAAFVSLPANLRPEIGAADPTDSSEADSEAGSQADA
jgi:hypothetical protein